MPTRVLPAQRGGVNERCACACVRVCVSARACQAIQIYEAEGVGWMDGGCDHVVSFCVCVCVCRHI